jgi:hypothetical protein
VANPVPSEPLLLGGGLSFGSWLLFRCEWQCEPDEFDVMILHPAGPAVYFPVFRGGWFCYRVATGLRGLTDA